ncbi:hypothetical protein Patl1_28472 [Pistacia atlantica]|uniref:Uncharacterized protein n=1 Tax=Pistacia atlantica TaxID=434234 RepID=A0ACC1BG99_9ROSI|nr:hypothetical protein Patl1_28472 [Pistacia atlantica]
MDFSEKTKLFVGGVSRETTEETLRQHFSSFGQVEESLIIRDRPTGIARGFGFVKFSNPFMAREALRTQHFILGRKVDVKPANTKSDRLEHSSVYGSDVKGYTQSSKKIFVGGLPHNLTEEEFKGYFECFGKVTDVVIIFDKQNQRSRGFGFVTFDLEEAADHVLQNSFYELKHKRVEVKRAEPKDRNEKYVNYYDCYSTGLASGYSSYFGFQAHPYYDYSYPPNAYALPITSSTHTPFGNPRFQFQHPSHYHPPYYPPYCFGGNGVYMNGWPSGTVDWTCRNDNLVEEYDSGTNNSIRGRRSGNLCRNNNGGGEIDGPACLKDSSSDHQSEGIDSHQNGEIDDATVEKVVLKRQSSQSSC